MEKQNIKIACLCLFCHSELQDDEGKEYKSGDMILCQKCGEYNDYDCLVSVTKEKAEKIFLKEAEKSLKKQFKNFLK